MAKAKFERDQTARADGTIGHIDHGKTIDRGDLEGAAREVSLDLNPQFAFDDIDKAPESIAGSPSRSHTSSTRLTHGTTPTSTARPRRLHQEHDHRRGADGRCDSRCRCDRRPDAADA